MRYRDAKRLHNGDEVTVGRGKDAFVATVKEVHDYPALRRVTLAVVCGTSWHPDLLHTDVH